MLGGGMGIWPSLEKEICPAHMHMLRHWLVRAGMPSTILSGLPGIHGVVTTGTQGAGVNTPKAAAVAEMTAGLEGDEHMPKEPMQVMGAKSLMFSSGLFDNIVILPGLAINGQGLVPKVHWIIADEVTYFSPIIIASQKGGQSVFVVNG